MGNVKEINIFANSLLDIVQEAGKVKPSQAAVHQQVNVAVLCRGSSMAFAQYVMVEGCVN